MDIPLYIDTTIKAPTTVWGDNNNFTVLVSGDGILLDNTNENYIALESLTMAYTWNNTDAAKVNNNIMRYSSDNGVSFRTIMFPAGNYTYSDLSNFISN